MSLRSAWYLLQYYNCKKIGHHGTYCNNDQFCPEWPLKFSWLNFLGRPEQFFICFFRKSKTNFDTLVSTPVLLHRGDVNCDWQITAKCQRVREKSLVIAVLRYIQDKHICVMAQVAWRTGDIIITDTICPPRSSVYSAGTIEDGIDGTCVLSNQFSMNVHTHIPQSIYQLYAWLSSSSIKMFQ